MARRTTTTPPSDDFEENIVDIDVTDEMRGSYLEYAYSVIYQRALPDARDGLKPVQRRILYQMSEMGLRPDRAHVKCARVVGEVMGRLHPHGDSAIYDALVRMAQPFAMRLPLVDGHGNFGSLGGDDAPAAMRYTEARLSAAALEMTTSLDEDTVDFIPNYDGQDTQPDVLPAALPNLLVNGASGIAVGMATNMAPHNLGEVVAAARYLIAHPDADLDTLMRFVPGPDLPTGGRIAGLDGIREAYQTGRGIFRTRATAQVEQVTPRRSGIVVTELPYGVGPEKVIARIKDLVSAKKLNGISDLKDLTDRHHGLRLVIEVRNGFVPEAVLAELYRLTPMEETFGINNVALVDGQPRVLGLRELLQIYVDHRIEVVRRRTAFRRAKRDSRLHLVAGLIIALLNIDEVIAVIRASDDTAAARERLMAAFDLSEIQAQYILDTPLRRLTRFDRLELERERETLQSEIAELTAILESEELLRRLVSDELGSVAERFATPRRTVLLEGSGVTRTAAVPLEVADDPCLVLLSSSGLLARTATAAPGAGGPGTGGTGEAPPRGGRAQRSAHDVITSSVAATARGTIGIVTSQGRLIRVGVLEVPALPPSASAPGLSGGAPAEEFVTLDPGESIVGLAAADGGGAGLAVGTAGGIVKRVAADYPQSATEFEVISLRDGDRVVGAVQLADEGHDLVFITSDAQLLRFGAGAVRPQGRAAGGMTGIRLNAGATVTWFGTVDPAGDAIEGPGGPGGPPGVPVVVTVADSASALPGTAATVKVTPYAEFPAKGRATGGVRCHRFLKGEDLLALAWAGPGPAAPRPRAGRWSCRRRRAAATGPGSGSASCSAPSAVRCRHDHGDVMTAPQPTIVATSIGFRAAPGNPGVVTAGPAYRYAAKLARAGGSPRICVLATALGDNPEYLTTFYSALGRDGFVVSHLSLFPMPNLADIADHLGRQDVIWVAGGSTANLLALWRVHGLDAILADCWAAGVVLMGVSAGSLCWHVGGTTDSFGPELRPVTNGLAFLPYSNSPHFDAEAQRRPLAHQLIGDGTLPDGYATDNGAGLVFYGTDLHEAIAEDPRARAYSLTRTGSGEVTERELPTRLL